MERADTFSPKIATGYEKLAINLEHHIRNYTPTTWTATISNVAYIPMVLKEEAKVFMALHKMGKLESGLEKLGKSKNSHFKQFKERYYQAAIKDFFDKESYKPYEAELN
ncbi:MAG: hypothetical protein KKF50_00215 [Nanoarchaeota archaeon]|nr:hypothetical protein [Nanoarchaeota archaeon]